MKKTIYKGEEYADVLYLKSKMKIPFYQRLLNLFRPELEIKITVYCKEIMPLHFADETHFSFISYRDKLKSWWMKKRGFDKMTCTPNRLSENSPQPNPAKN